MSMIKNMGLAWVAVADVKRAKKFFVEDLGLTLVTDNEEHGWLELAPEDGMFMLGVGKACDETGKEVSAGSNAIVTMTVDDIVEAKALLEKKLVKIIGDIIEIPGHVKMLMFTDYDSNKFQLVEMLDEQ